MLSKIAIINGPNLNLLGVRQPHIYGAQSFEGFFAALQVEFAGRAELTYFQSNSEGALIDELQKIGFSVAGILLNAGAYTHSSIALRDCIAAISSPVLEIHISNTQAREAFRHVSHIAPVARGGIFGLGLAGYRLGVEYFLAQ